MLDIAKHMLEYVVSLEMQPDVVELDSDWESLSSVEQRKTLAVPSGSCKKQTYRVLDGKKQVQSPGWKVIAMTSFDFKDNPFWWIREEINQL